MQDQLDAAGVVSVDTRRVLGILPVRHPHRSRARGRAARHRVGCRATARWTPADAALVGLVAAGDLRSVPPRRDRRRHAARIDACTERAGDAIPALTQVLHQVRSAHVTAASGGG